MNLEGIADLLKTAGFGLLIYSETFSRWLNDTLVRKHFELNEALKSVEGKQKIHETMAKKWEEAEKFFYTDPDYLSIPPKERFEVRIQYLNLRRAADESIAEAFARMNSIGDEMRFLRPQMHLRRRQQILCRIAGVVFVLAALACYFR